MSLVPSLLQAIVHVDGEALVMHAGDKPYVVSPAGQVDLASRGLTLDAVNGIVGQLLPPEQLHALDEFGAVQYQLTPGSDFPQEHFTVVAARGGDDLWVEIRRRRIPDEDSIPEDMLPPRDEVRTTEPYPVYAAAGSPSLKAPEHPLPDGLDVEDAAITGMLPPLSPSPEFEASSAVPSIASDDVASAELASRELSSPDLSSATAIDLELNRVAPASIPAPPAAPAPPPPAIVARTPEPEAPKPLVSVVAPVERPRPVPEPRPEPPQPAVVVPIARNPIRADVRPPSVDDPTMSGLDRLLRVSAARGASTLYLSSASKPSVRVDGELQMLDGEAVLAARDVESLLLTLMPERNHEALRTGAATEWIIDIEDVGRVRCMSFRDHRGPGGVFRLMPTRAVSVEQLMLPKAVHALGIEPEGLVLVTGPRSSGKRTLISAFVDLINRTRRDHVITIEREVNIVHERGSSFVSQREVRGSDDDLLAAARSALREDPDVLVIEDLRTAGLVSVALEAATSGHLVIAGFSAHTATAAIDRIIDLYPAEHRRQVQFALADTLRGVIVQVLLRKSGGGRVAAREVLLNTPAVSSVIAEGKTSQLPMALEGGRRYGMMPLNDSLIALVQQGLVDAREAYRLAGDRTGLLAALQRQGVDTSFVERLA